MEEAEDLKLIYVQKCGHNHKGEGSYEFIFSLDPSNIDVEAWCWDISPACDNAIAPSEEYIEQVIELKTSSFDLFCLHDSVDREYMHGFHNIHALAYETEVDVDDNGQSQYEKLIESCDDQPLLVFHYGMSLERIIEIFKARKITLRDDKFIEISSIKIKNKREF